MVREKTFREDLYYRLAVIPVHIPPLRERPGDLPALVVHILDKLTRRLGQETKAVSPDVMDLFRRYTWPGNIRELENVLEHGFVCSAGKIITTDSLPQHVREDSPPAVAEGTVPAAPDGDERALILAALRENDWHMQDTAGALGMNRTTLWRKMKKYDIRK
jgi:transcriptional regulator with PAS, ATPase and Fis domain